jgi:hypothetical protein
MGKHEDRLHITVLGALVLDAGRDLALMSIFKRFCRGHPPKPA